MRAHLALALLPLSLTVAACGRPDATETIASRQSALTGGISPASQTVFEGQPARWSGTLTMDELVDGAPTRIAWDYDTDGIEDTEICGTFTPCADVCSNTYLLPEISANVPFPVTRSLPVDVDGDGDDDLVVFRTDEFGFGHFLSVVRSTGRTMTPDDFDLDPFINAPAAVATGDVDGDLDLDVVQFGSLSEVLVNDGTGVFTALSSFSATGTMAGAALADIDGDGDLDAVYASGATLYAHLNDGFGTFGIASTIPLAFVATALGAGDLDGDGDDDVLLGTPTALAVFFANGTGGFSAPVSYAMPNVEEILLADLDGVNGIDVVAVGDFGGTLFTRWNDGSGGLLPGEALPANGGGAAVGDVDGDGFLDVAIGGGSINGVIDVYLGAGDGTLVTPPVPTGGLGADTSPGLIEMGDLDGDGFADLVSGAARYYGRDDGRMGPATYVPAGGPVYFARELDVNDDGHLDVAAAVSGVGIALFLGDGAGSFTPGPLVTSFAPFEFHVAFLDADAFPDFVVPGGVVLSTGPMTWSAMASLPGGISMQAIAVGDIDGDGDADLVSNDGLSASLQFFANDGSGTFSAPVAIGVGSTRTAVAIEDVDGDGDLDIATSGSTGPLRILYNNGLGAFPFTQDVGFFSFNIAQFSFGDLDLDGDPDIVLVSGNAFDMRIARNSGGSFFEDAQNGRVMPFQSRDPRIADVTGDGRPDVVLSSQQGSTVTLFEGGEFGLSDAIARTAGANPISSAIGDFDEDGGLDIATANLGGELSILFSTPSVWTCPVASEYAYFDSGDYTATLALTMTLGSAAFPATVAVPEVDPEIQSIFGLGALQEFGETVFVAYALVAPGDFATQCTWDFGDGTQPQTDPFCGAFVAENGDGRWLIEVQSNHVYADGDPTDYTVTLTISDEDASGFDEYIVTIQNAATSPPFNLGVIGTPVEGVPVTLTANIDPLAAPDAPFRVDWHIDALSPVADASVVSLTVGAALVELAFPDSGAFNLLATITDQVDAAGVESPGSLTSNPGFLSITVADHAPEIGAITGAAVEGQLATFTASVAGVPSDLLVSCVWSFGDGSPSQSDPGCAGLESGTSSGTHVYTEGDPTDYTVTLTVTDEDGSELAMRTVSVQNAGEGVSIDSVTPQPVIEGTNVDVAISIPGDGAGDADAPFHVRWIWGDGSTTEQVVATIAGPVSASHTYPDQGSYTLELQVTDQVGPTGAATFGSQVSAATTAVSVDNAPPVFGVVTDRTATEGTLLLFALPATDPAGANDPLSFSLVSGPAGMSITEGGTLGWVPTYSQSGGGAGLAHAIDVQVSDGDGGSDSVTFTVRAQWKDDDGDGMADTWELANGMDPTIDDSLGDADGDGIVNINEFNGTGPFTPNTVTPISPLTDEEVNVEDPVLVVQNTTDDDSGALTYVFELFSDAALATLVHQGSAVEDTAGMTAFTLDDTLTDEFADGDDPANPENVDLADDTTYWWRARAFDGTYFGPWSPVQAFHYDPTNDPPNVATFDSPMNDETVATLAPVLVIGNPPPDDDPPGEVEFRVYLDDPAEGGIAIGTSFPMPIGNFGTTSWLVSPPLPIDDRHYYWQVTVMDARGGSTLSGQSLFRVNVGNDEPSEPEIVSPLDGVSVTTAEPTLEATGSIDVDGDALTYLFDLDVTPSFNSPDRQSGEGIPCGVEAENRCFATAQLAENAVYWWRVRVGDGSAIGEQALATFRVDQANDAPGVPVPVSPSDSLVITETPAFVALAAIDPEEEALTYDFQVLDADGAIVAEDSGIAPGDGSVTWTPETALELGGRYSWQVRAVDARGLAGAFSGAASFEVYQAPKSGGGGGRGGCSVAYGGSPIGSLLVLFAIARLLRRRSRCQRSRR